MFHVNSLLAEMPLTVALILYQVAAWGWLLKLTVTAQFRVLDTTGSQFAAPVADLPTYVLAWTTTPWTLPSNTALCVGPKIDYVCVKGQNPYTAEEALYIVAESRLSAYFTAEEGQQLEILWRGKGTDLVGLRYAQLMPWVKVLRSIRGRT